MKYIRLGLNWVFGIVFLLLGLYSLSEYPVGGLALILISSLLLPPVRNFVRSRTSKELSLKARALVILLLFGASYASVVEGEARRGRELAAMEAQERIQEEFALSQKRHSRFSFVDTWNHAQYVEGNGVGLCVICHNLEAGGARLFGPSCMSCHRDIQAFEVSAGEEGGREKRELVAEVQEGAKKEYAQSRKQHVEFFGVDTWNHADYVEENGVVLCVICHNLEAGGPNMHARGPRCMSCHRDIQAFADSIRHRRLAGPISQ